MPINILMPALSPTMEKGNLARWLKKEGDRIKAGDVLAEIETDKATMEVEAIDDGVLAKIVVADGTADVPVNQLIGLIAADGEDAKAVAAGGADGPRVGNGKAEAATPATPSTPAPAAPAPVAAPVVAAGARVFASPLARRIAKDANLDLGKVSGTGPHGRVVERDVKAAIAGGGAKAAPASAPAAAPAPVAAPSAPTTMGDDMVKKLFAPGSYEEIPHDGMRKTIARRLTDAKASIPHFYLTVDCELDPLLALREQINAAAPKDKDGKPAYKVSVNDFVVKALAVALQHVPAANVTWTEGAMLKHKHSDISVAVAIPDGLITPIVRNAELKGLAAIANEMKDFAARAKARKLKPEEYQGGVSAVSNLGMFGMKHFTAVINPPQSSILAVGAGEQRMVVKKGQPVVATVMTATLSCDHRAIDGALGAQLLSAFKQLIENPIGMLV